MKIDGHHAHAASGNLYWWSADYTVAIFSLGGGQISVRITIRHETHTWDVRGTIEHGGEHIHVVAPELVAEIVNGVIDRIDERTWRLAPEDQ